MTTPTQSPTQSPIFQPIQLNKEAQGRAQCLRYFLGESPSPTPNANTYKADLTKADLTKADLTKLECKIDDLNNTLQKVQSIMKTFVVGK